MGARVAFDTRAGVHEGSGVVTGVGSAAVRAKVGVRCGGARDYKGGRVKGWASSCNRKLQDQLSLSV